MRAISLALVVGLIGAGSLQAQAHHQGHGPGREQPQGMMGSMGAMGGMRMMGGTGAMDGMQMMGMMGPMAEFASFAPGQILAHREQLELSDEQATALAALQEKTDMAAEDAHAPAHAAMEGLRQELEAETPNTERVRQLFTAHQTAMGNVQLIRLEAAIEARTLLTPEQRGMIKGMGMHGGPGMPHGHQGGMRD
jgi:Spy/CpxP family protein refolding chaperone